MKIEILRGPSGSGKSTYASSRLLENDELVIVSRDLIREEITGKYKFEYSNQGFDYQIEEAVTKEEHKQLAKAIIKSKDIIIDNTNIRHKYIQEYVNIFNDLNVNPGDVEVIDFDVDFNTCMKRVNERVYMRVPEDIVRKQLENLQNRWKLNEFIENGHWKATRDKQKWYYLPMDIIPYEPEIEFKKAVIVDIDGTSAKREVYKDITGVHLRDFKDYSKVEYDSVKPFIQKVVKCLELSGIKIIFLSGRKEECREQTQEWIEKNMHIQWNPANVELHMRNNLLPDGCSPDHRKDYIVKYELFNKYIREKYNVIGWIDDRKQILALVEELGIPALNAGSLNEEF